MFIFVGDVENTSCRDSWKIETTGAPRTDDVADGFK